MLLAIRSCLCFWQFGHVCAFGNSVMFNIKVCHIIFQLSYMYYIKVNNFIGRIYIELINAFSDIFIVYQDLSKIRTHVTSKNCKSSNYRLRDHITAFHLDKKHEGGGGGGGGLKFTTTGSLPRINKKDSICCMIKLPEHAKITYTMFTLKLRLTTYI